MLRDCTQTLDRRGLLGLIQVGRVHGIRYTGPVGDTKTVRRRPDLVVSVENHRDHFEAEPDGPHRMVLRVPDCERDENARAHDELYAAARGALCNEYGPPLTEAEKAFDALAASIVNSRGTNGTGLGWDPPERDRLREAGHRLQEHPERMQEFLQYVETIERRLYPLWPEREHEFEHERVLDLEKENDHEPLDRERHRYYHEADRWCEEHERDRGRRGPDKPPP